MRHALLVALLSLVSLSPAQAQSMDGVFRRAVEAHRAGRLAEAGVLYEQLVVARVDDPDVWANLGLVYAETNRRGRAMVAFERALSHRPDDAEIARALESVESSLARGRAEREGEVTIGEKRGALETIARSFSEPGLSLGLLVFDFLLCFSLLALLSTRRESLRITLGVTAAVSFLLVVADGTLLLARRGAFRDADPAIVLAREAQVHDAPDPRSPSAGALEEGQRVRVLERSGEFSRVSSSVSGRGWVRSDELGVY